MKEPDEGKTTQLQPLTIGQAAEFINIREVHEPIGAFAANAKGVKALKQLYKAMLDGFKRYSNAINGDQFPGLALVFHKSKDQLSGLTPAELHLELTNKENYSLWEVSELSVYNIAKFSRKWGPSGLWGGDTDFMIDVTECEDLVYLLSAEVEDLVDTMASQHAALAA